jgi:hypothetical protein
MNCTSCEVRTEFLYVMYKKVDCLCGLAIGVSGYISRGSGSLGYQIFWEVVGLERGPLSLVSTIEELFERKNSGSGLENREYGRRDPLCWPRDTLYPQKLSLTSLTSCGHLVGIVRSRTKATEFVCFFFLESWSETESYLKVGKYLSFCTSPGLCMMSLVLLLMTTLPLMMTIIMKKKQDYICNQHKS